MESETEEVRRKTQETVTGTSVSDVLNIVKPGVKAITKHVRRMC